MSFGAGGFLESMDARVRCPASTDAALVASGPFCPWAAERRKWLQQIYPWELPGYFLAETEMTRTRRRGLALLLLLLLLVLELVLGLMLVLVLVSSSMEVLRQPRW